MSTTGYADQTVAHLHTIVMHERNSYEQTDDRCELVAQRIRFSGRRPIIESVSAVVAQLLNASNPVGVNYCAGCLDTYAIVAVRFARMKFWLRVFAQQAAPLQSA